MIAEAMATGIDAVGESVGIVSSLNYLEPVSAVAVFYGFDEQMRRVYRGYLDAGRTVVCVDLGYWSRKTGPLDGHHKVSVNGRHPTAYFQRVTHPADRFDRLGIQIKSWQRSGAHILVAGMSGKSAGVEGFAPSQWERETIERLRRTTKRPIVYRPKPSWKEAQQIGGARYDNNALSLPSLLQNCHAVVTHHSNVAVDALMAGVPVFATSGVGSVLGLQDLGQIESPIRPDGREQFAADLAYTQWTPEEIRSGACWRHLKSEGLVP